MDIDLSQYMGMYVDGSRENLDLMDKHLLALEQDTDNIEAVGEIFRAAHTLKGMSATMGFEKVAHLTHEMENVLDKFRNHTVAVTPEIIDILFETFDCLRTLVNDSIDSTDSNVDLEGISAKLAECVSGNSSEKTSPKPVSAPSVSANKAFDSGIDYSKELAEFPINEFEYQVLVEASQRNWHIFLLTVTLVQDCLLKAPRAFMVTRTLDEFSCEILKSSPETKDIEEEKFDLSFKLLVVGEVVLDNLKKAIEEISEIDSVKVLKLKPEDFLRLSGEKPAVAAERRPYAQTEPTKVVSAPNTAFQNEASAANRIRPAVEQKASTESLTTGAAPAPAAPSDRKSVV